MSVDMAVWEGERPSGEDAGQVFEALYDRYIEREYPTEPTPTIKEFVETLTTTFPDLDALGDDEVDDSPWADSPLLGNASGPFIYFAMVANEAGQSAWDLARATAERLGLIGFDPQSGRLI
jgi:predicted small integral membrane protein